MGTPFSTGQLGKLQAIVSIAVSTALPRVAVKFSDPKSVLRALSGKGEILAQRLEAALEQAINGMLALIRRGQMTLTISERRDPDVYYRTREGLWIYGGFRDLVVAKAKPVEPGTTFKVDEDELGETLTDEEIEAALPKNHLFDESAGSAIVAEMIETEQLDKNCVYLLYTSSCVVLVGWDAGLSEWDVLAWYRGGHRWSAGARVLSPAD